MPQDTLSLYSSNPAGSSPGGGRVPSGAPHYSRSARALESGSDEYAAQLAGVTLPAQAQYKIVIVGDSGVGKTCLLVRFTEASFGDSSASTIGVDFTSRDVTVGSPGLRVKLQMWDTAGQERYRAAMTSYYRGAHGIIFAYAVDNRKSFAAIEQWVIDVERFAGAGCAKLIVATVRATAGASVVSPPFNVSWCRRRKLTFPRSSG